MQGVQVLYSVVGAAAYADVAGGRRVTEPGDRRGRRRGVSARATAPPSACCRRWRPRNGPTSGTVWFIDEISDKSAIDKGRLLLIVVWNLVPVYSAMIEDLKAKQVQDHDAYTIQLADDSVHLLHTPHIPDAVWTEIEAKRRQIIDGKIKIVDWDSMQVAH